MNKNQSPYMRKASKVYDKERQILLENHPRALQIADLMSSINATLSIVYDITLPIGHTGCHVKNAEDLNTLLEWSSESRDKWDSHKEVANAIWETYPESFILVDVDPDTKEWLFKATSQPHEKGVSLIDVETLTNAPLYKAWTSVQFIDEQAMDYVRVNAKPEYIAYFDHLGKHDDILLYVSKLKVICDSLLLPEGFFGRFKSVQEDMVIPITILEDYVRTAYNKLSYASSRITKNAASIMKWKPSRPLPNDVTQLTPHYVHADTILRELLFEIRELNQVY